MAPVSEETNEQFPTVIERKHQIKRYHRLIGGQWFWVADIWKPGATKPYVGVCRPESSDSLDTVTKEAKHLVGVLIRNNGRIPVNEIENDVVFDTTKGLEGLNPRSASGKPQWCPKHWSQVEAGMVARTHNGIVAGIVLTSVSMQKALKSGLIKSSPNDPYAMEMLRDSYSPLCCWLGDKAVEEILDMSRNEELEKPGSILEQLNDRLKQQQK